MPRVQIHLIKKMTEFSRDFEFANPKFAGMPRDELKTHMMFKAIEFLKEELKETEDAIRDTNRAEIVDGFGDIAFVAINGIYKEFRTHGYWHTQATELTEEVLRRICIANLAKRSPDGTVIFENGKVQKPEGWTPPSYEDVL